jgi:hypothetical protein
VSSSGRKKTSSRGSRFYVWGRGERYWSVTTILSALPKEALKAWAARTVAEFAFDRSSTWFTMSRAEAVAWLKDEPLRYTKERADVGSAIHAAAEAYALSKPLPREWAYDEERVAVGHFLRYCEALRPRFVMTEAQVYNRTQKYAGTLDSIQEIDFDRLLELCFGNEAAVPWPRPEGGRPLRLLVDYKTGGDLEEDKGVYPEVALQLVAYDRAEFVGLINGQEVPVPVTDGAVVLHVNAGGWRLVPVDVKREDLWRTFLYVREVYRWKNEISKEVLGAPIYPRSDETPAEPAAELETEPTTGRPARRPPTPRRSSTS